jgi:Rieske Fe-S protein
MRERRRFLQVLGVGAGALAPACVIEQVEETSTTTTSSTSSGAGGGGSTVAATSSAASTGTGSTLTPVAKVSELPMGSLKTVGSSSLLLGRDAGGVYAMTSICTHSGCDMCFKGQQFAGGIRCTCHSSQFDLLGAVLQGPAGSPLKHYLVAVDAAGVISVDKTQVVAADFRAAIPTG